MNDVLNELLEMRKDIHAQNVAKGFWAKGKDENKGERAMLIITELAEAVEADRKGVYGHVPNFYAALDSGMPFEKAFETRIKDCVSDEMADTVIRTLDYIEGFSVRLVDDYSLFRLSDNFADNVREITKMVNQSADYHKNWFNTIVCIIYLCDHYKIDILQHVKWKLKYNATRPAKHGKSY